MENVCLYYFSGSGNTLTIAKKVQQAFKDKSYECELINMEDGIVRDHPYSYIGLLYPVAIQSTFPLVWEFVKNLPKTDNQKIFMISTMMLFAGGSTGPMKRAVQKNGYTPVGALELKMPSNIATDERDEKKDAAKIKEALALATQFVEDLIQGRTKWKRIPILSDIIRLISKKRSIWKKISRRIDIYTDKCTLCNQCIKECPTKALYHFNGHIEIDHNACECCMRCVNLCPENAFFLYGKKVYQNTILKDTQK